MKRVLSGTKRVVIVMKRILKDFIHLLKNVWVAGFFSYILILIAYLIEREIWGYVFAILVAYLISDFILIFSIKEGKENVQIPFVGANPIKHKGHNYLAFLFIIVISSILSGFLSHIVTGWIEGFKGIISIIIPNLIILALIYADFHLTFYRR